MAENTKQDPKKKRFWMPKTWTFLLVGDLGKTTSFEVSRFLFIALLVTIGLLVVYAVGMTVGFYRVYSLNDGLEERLAAADAERLAPQADWDVAEVRRMLQREGQPEPAKPVTEDKVKTPPPASEAPLVVAAKPPVSPTAGEKKRERADAAPEVVTPAEPAPAAAEAEEPEEETVVRKVRVESFQIWPVNDNTAVRFKFKLENASPIDIKIRGYTFVALEPDEIEEEPVRVAPWSPLKDGEPSLIKRGQYFGISRFKYVQVTLPDVVDVTRFRNATVYVYSETGTLLHKQVWKVEDALRS